MCATPTASATPSSADGNYELVVAMEPVKARIHMQPLYDPAGARVKS